jgi:hypothetical protein
MKCANEGCRQASEVANRSYLLSPHEGVAKEETRVEHRDVQVRKGNEARDLPILKKGVRISDQREADESCQLPLSLVPTDISTDLHPTLINPDWPDS